MAWLPKERMAWKPPARLTVSEWAEAERVLDTRTSSRPGPWRNARTPYLAGMMDVFTLPHVSEITYMTGTQVGKTEAILNQIGWAVSQDPGSAMVVYPTEDIARGVSKLRIQPLFESSPTVSERHIRNESTTLEIHFWGGYICLSGANSPSSLASRPIRYLWLDEVDKYPPYLGEEADPISLARERTKTYTNRKVVQCSTPTVEKGAIYQSYLSADVRYAYHVPCPYCGYMQPFTMSGIKFPEQIREDMRNAKGDPEKLREVAQRARASSWYECSRCGEAITDSQKMSMLLKGQWVPDRDVERPRHVAFHLNSIYAPALTFGDVAAEFIQAKDFPDRLRNFINSWLGEPWRENNIEIAVSEVMRHETQIPRGQVPREAWFLTGGVDVQKDYMVWEVRAWGRGATSWLVDCGRAETWDTITSIMDRGIWRTDDSRVFHVRLCLVDAGFRTDEVYEFCSKRPDLYLPCKGSSRPLNGKLYTVTNIDRQGAAPMKLWIHDSGYWKGWVHSRIAREPGELGAWRVFARCPKDYAEQIVAERKVMALNRRTGVYEEVWEKVTSHAANHFLDTAVLNALAAELLQIRYMDATEPTEETKAAETPPPAAKKPERYRPVVSDWVMGR